ncbi:hypothetical protein RhiirC2_853818 [Rhizophagus irregularis]|uniref:Uncharacterized protein n=1 Tax=Rhizophagus irregularis TaxID=588596 RepID=A0A2N1MU54_9GLOM|nr:hypothetical protein RhiirC2_853818 [Rhizophagus irregularis]
MKKDVWLRLTNCKNRPLSEEQVRGIHPDIEELLTREVNRYFNKKNNQKIKIEANTSSDGSSTLSRLDGFEKQLEERELCVQQWENNIKKTIDAQVAEERKRLKDEYDALKSCLESEYNNCMVDMKQKTYSFKHQLESQHNSRLAELEKQYKSHISALDKANAEQVRGIHPDIEELLTREVDRYFNKKNRQKIKIEANTTSDGSSTLSRLDGFEKQLEERELHVQKRENNIKNTIEGQVAEERKRLKDEYDALMARKEKNQHKSRSDNLEKQYKAQITTLEKSIVIKDKEIGKLSATISQLKNDKKDIKKSVERKCKDLEDVIFAKDLKIITLNDRINSFNHSAGRDGTIEPSTFISFHDTEFWSGRREDAKRDPSIRKKYTFRTRV